MQPTKELLSIKLFPNKEGFTTQIGTQMTNLIAKQVIDCLRRNANIFAFLSADLVGVEPEIALHCLHVDPKVKPVKQKLRQFGREKDKVISEEVAKLLEAGHIREVQFPEWLSNAIMVPKETRAPSACALISTTSTKLALRITALCRELTN